MNGRRWLAGILLALAAGAISASPDLCSNATMASLRQLKQAQSAPVQQTLQRIEGRERQLLALRSYLRSRDSLGTRWSWSQDQIDAYRGSDEYRDLLAEIEKIRARFEAANPGVQLYANTEVRSLDQQIERWNKNDGVGALAQALMQDVCGPPASGESAMQLQDFLVRWQSPSAAPLAAPGLSLHGRARAIDFQVHQGDRVLAGPETARIAEDWEAAGWAQKLAVAVRTASAKFTGPLSQPNEPWHYEYRGGEK